MTPMPTVFLHGMSTTSMNRLTENVLSIHCISTAATITRTNVERLVVSGTSTIFDPEQVPCCSALKKRLMQANFDPHSMPRNQI